MKYLSFDIESTGLDEGCLLIEFGMIPFCTETLTLNEKLSQNFTIQCPPFDELKNQLDPWVAENNEQLIRKANKEGITLKDFKTKLTEYLESEAVKKYFNFEKIVLFGKSMSAIDLPFLNRDLGWDFMRKYFVHRQLDLSAVGYALVDLNLLDPGMDSGSELMNKLDLGEVPHTALEDAKLMATAYLKILKMGREHKLRSLLAK